MRKSLNLGSLEHDDRFEVTQIDIGKIINNGQNLRSMIRDFIFGQELELEKAAQILYQTVCQINRFIRDLT